MLYENSSVGSVAAAESDSGSHLQLLVYETEPLKTSSTAQHVHRTMEMSGIDITVIGQDTNFQGFGSKYSAAIIGVYHHCIVYFCQLICNDLPLKDVCYHFIISPSIVF